MTLAEAIFARTPAGFRFRVRESPLARGLSEMDKIGAALGVRPKDRDGGAWLRARKGTATVRDCNTIMLRLGELGIR